MFGFMADGAIGKRITNVSIITVTGITMTGITVNGGGKSVKQGCRLKTAALPGLV